MDLRRSILPLVTGLVVGHLSVIGGPPGLMIAVIGTALALASYWLRRDVAAVGWLLVGGGAAWSLLLGRVVLDDLSDPAVETEPLTAAMVAAAVGAIVVGLALVAWSRRATTA